MQEIFESVLARYSQQFAKSTVLVYGSLASGSFHARSDVDVVVFAEVDAAYHEGGELSGHLLDAWVHPVADVQNTSDFLRVVPLVTIRDDYKVAELLAARIQIERDSAISSVDEKKLSELDAWVHKMVGRARVDSSEGNYRYHWLLHDYPELYCLFRGVFCDGPAKTLRRLSERDPALSEMYSSLLGNKKDVDLLENLWQDTRTLRPPTAP